jgi:hypothetical protein
MFTIALAFAAYLGLAQAAPLLPVNLGSAGNYVILTTAGMTNVPSSVITGDIGVSPIAGTGITGMALVLAGSYSTSAQVTGKVFAADYAAPTPATLTTAILGSFLGPFFTVASIHLESISTPPINRARGQDILIL